MVSSRHAPPLIYYHTALAGVLGGLVLSWFLRRITAFTSCCRAAASTSSSSSSDKTRGVYQQVQPEEEAIVDDEEIAMAVALEGRGGKGGGRGSLDGGEGGRE